LAYSPEAQGRSGRAFASDQERLPKELALAGITDMTAANAYLRDVYQPAFNAEFSQPPIENGTAFVPFLRGIWTTFCANNFNGLWAKIIVFVSRGLRYS